MTHSRKNQGTCSSRTALTLSEGGVIENISVEGGCQGNLQGLCNLLRGRGAREAIPLLKGVPCGDKPSSCPDQIAACIEEALILMGH